MFTNYPWRKGLNGTLKATGSHRLPSSLARSDWQPFSPPHSRHSPPPLSFVPLPSTHTPLLPFFQTERLWVRWFRQASGGGSSSGRRGWMGWDPKNTHELMIGQRTRRAGSSSGGGGTREPKEWCLGGSGPAEDCDWQRAGGGLGVGQWNRSVCVEVAGRVWPCAGRKRWTLEKLWMVGVRANESPEPSLGNSVFPLLSLPGPG